MDNYKFVLKLEINNFVFMNENHQTPPRGWKLIFVDFFQKLADFLAWRRSYFKFLIQTHYSEGSRLSFERRLLLKCRVPLSPSVKFISAKIWTWQIVPFELGKMGEGDKLTWCNFGIISCCFVLMYEIGIQESTEINDRS